MADINFDCPHCGKNLEIDERGAGLQVRCPDCKQAIFVPRLEQPVAPGQAVQVPPVGANAPSMYQPPPQPIYPAGMPMQYRPLRPTSVTVFGTLGIVFGSLGLLSMLLTVALTAALPDVLHARSVYKTWMVISQVIGLVVVSGLLAVGIGLLRLKRWARVGGIIYGWVAIATNILGFVMNILAITSDWIRPDDGGMPGFVIGTVAGGLIGLILPITMIVFMSRRPAVEACVN